MEPAGVEVMPFTLFLNCPKCTGERFNWRWLGEHGSRDFIEVDLDREDDALKVTCDRCGWWTLMAPRDAS